MKWARHLLVTAVTKVQHAYAIDSGFWTICTVPSNQSGQAGNTDVDQLSDEHASGTARGINERLHLIAIDISRSPVACCLALSCLLQLNQIYQMDLTWCLLPTLLHARDAQVLGEIPEATFRQQRLSQYSAAYDRLQHSELETDIVCRSMPNDRLIDPVPLLFKAV